MLDLCCLFCFIGQNIAQQITLVERLVTQTILRQKLLCPLASLLCQIEIFVIPAAAPWLENQLLAGEFVKHLKVISFPAQLPVSAKFIVILCPRQVHQHQRKLLNRLLIIFLILHVLDAPPSFKIFADLFSL